MKRALDWLGGFAFGAAVHCALAGRWTEVGLAMSCTVMTFLAAGAAGSSDRGKAGET